MMICQVRDASSASEVLLETGIKKDAPHPLVYLFSYDDEPDLGNIQQRLKTFDVEIGVDITDEVGRTLLNRMADSGMPEIVSYLLEKGADPNASVGDSSPLSTAASDNQHEIVKLLLDRGANPNNDDGQSPALGSAALMSATQSVALLLEAGANPSSFDEYLESALHQAIYEGPKALIELLLNAGADSNHFNNTQTSPLMYAIDQDRPKIVAALLIAGADVNLRDSNGKTALYHATERGYDYNPKLKACIEALLEGGADGKLTSFSSTPYSNASSYKKMAKQILNFETTTQFKNFASDDVVEFAKQVNAYRLQLWIIKDLDFAKELIQAGAGKSELRGFSPLITALEIENIDLVQLLIDEGYSPDGLDLYDESALQIACGKGFVEAVIMLLDAGADLDYTAPSGSGSLCYAVDSEKIELVKLLLQRGANVNIMKVGWSPLYRAASNDDLKMVELLLEAGASKETKTRTNKNAYDIALEKEYTEIAWLLE